MTTFTDLPNDLLLILASYWTTSELYSLLLTSKNFNAKFNLHAGITRIIIDNNMASDKGGGFAIYDDKMRQFYHRNIIVATEKSDLAMMKTMIEVHKKYYNGNETSSNNFSILSNQLVLRNIWANDSDALLQQIVSYYMESLTTEEWINQLIPKLAELTLMPEFLSRCDAKNTRKTFEMTLKLFNNHISTIFAHIIPLVTDVSFKKFRTEPLSMNNWYSFIEALLYCKKKYPELLSFDLNHSNYVNDPELPLGLAARAANPELFDLFLKNGAKNDNKNYVQIAYEKSGVKASKFVRHLMAKGCNLNAPVQGYEQPYSLLALFQNKRLPQYKWVIEDLLMKGAKLSLDEEKIFLMDEAGTERHRLAMLQKKQGLYKYIQEKMNGFQLLTRLKALGFHPTFINPDLSIEIVFTEHNAAVIKRIIPDLDPLYTEWHIRDGLVEFSQANSVTPIYRFAIVQLYNGKMGFLLKECYGKSNVDLSQLWLSW